MYIGIGDESESDCLGWLVRTLTYQKRKILKPYVMKEEGLKKGENAL